MSCAKTKEDMEKSEIGNFVSEGVTVAGLSSLVQLYTLEEVEHQIIRHSVLHISSSPDIVKRGPVRDVFNILMADVSSSMDTTWPYLVKAWNQHIANDLTGRTEIYVFDDTLTFVRDGSELKESDFIGKMTDLCLALEKIRDRVEACTERYARVFLVTDGCHNATDEDPNDVIQTLQTPSEKTCEVYVLGVGYLFPVQYSIDIRSRLHNGCANMPTLFWAKEDVDVEEEIKDIRTHLLKSKIPVKLNLPGSLMPGLEDTHNFHLDEWVYMACDPDTLTTIQLSMEEDKKVEVLLEVHPLTIDLFLDSVVPQWTSVLIQRHNLKKPNPDDVFPFMERTFQVLFCQVAAPETDESPTIHARLLRKRQKELKTQYQTLVNRSKIILTTKKFMNEITLAESILMTTVTTRKHAVKGLKLKSHEEESYAEDCKSFMDIYISTKEKLDNLDHIPEDCCQVTMTSTLSDLKDEGFPELLKLDKLEFLKTFSMSGIPVFSRSRNSTELNPWSFKIDRILTSPFSVLSQIAMEEFANVDAGAVGQNKKVHHQQDNQDISYNAVVPVFSAAAAKVMKPLVCTNLYAMCATFALLKNPDIVDHTIHLAGLAAIWIKTLEDYPVERPHFVKERLENVAVTATMYLDRPILASYIKELQINPGRALMTECPPKNPKAMPLKCEAILKPLFLMHMMDRAGNPLDHEVKVSVIRLATVEFLGRCLYHTIFDGLPFSRYIKGIPEEGKRKEWLCELFQGFSEEILIYEESLLSRFYFPEQIIKYTRKLLKTKQETFLQVLSDAIKPEVTGLEKLYSVHNCGDVTWKSLQVCAVELGLSDFEIKKIFSEKNALIYVYHALTHTSSSERMKVGIVDYDTCLEKVKSKLIEEVIGCARKIVQEEVQSAFLKRWYEAYDSCHGGSIIIRPMTRTEIMEEAKAKGIIVTSETFDKVYLRYNEELGLLRNACQSPGCPFYLQPNLSFSQHVKNERRQGRFLHRLHHVASGDEDLETKVKFIKSCDSNTKRVTPEILEVYRQKLEILSPLYKKMKYDNSNIEATTLPGFLLGLLLTLLCLLYYCDTLLSFPENF